MIKPRAGENTPAEARAESHETIDKERRYRQIIECLKSGELTAKECAVKMYEKGFIPTTERNFAAPRLTELSARGIVEPVGRKKCRYTGKTVSVYALRKEQK